MNANNTGFEAIGSSLIEHVRDTAASRQGIVDELFPYIVQASKKISARAIARFLEEHHSVKISYVTIGRALRNPKKHWNQYYDDIEDHAWIVAEAFDKTLKDFMSQPEKYQEMLEGKPVITVEDINDSDSRFRADLDFKNAVAVLDEKWFCFEEETLEDARFYLIQRFLKKPAPDTAGE